MRYINIMEGTNQSTKETIDEFPTIKEAREMLKEYHLVYMGTGWSVWMSQKCCNDWRDA